MSNIYPTDRFDEVPATEGRVGAHRRPPAPHARAIAFAWAALATGVIVLLGFIGLLVIDDRVEFTDVFTPPSAGATPTAVATVDPTLGVSALNGTATAGLAAKASSALTAAGWRVPTVANANTEDVAVTTIYYTDPALEGAALGLADSLGVGTPKLSQDFVETGTVVVVLGTDFAAKQG